ncbi:MAG: sugar phosphate isomerase/epimerase family protein [Isosphaeraceae bacterium]
MERRMMELGIFAKTFAQTEPLDELARRIASFDFKAVQFNLSCLGLPTLPNRPVDTLCAEVSAVFREHGLRLAAVSGTFNLLKAARGDPAQPLDPFQRLNLLAYACRSLDSPIITLCTGTCDPENMWRWHPDNRQRETWRILVEKMREVAKIAERHEVTMAFEPEIGNVVNSSLLARLLLEELASPWIKVVIDPANLFRPGDLPRMAEILDQAFERLGPHIVLAHAKELSGGGEAGGLAPGKGVLDWDHYLACLERTHYTGPLIIHGLPEAEVSDAVAFLHGKIDGTPMRNNGPGRGELNHGKHGTQG